MAGKLHTLQQLFRHVFRWHFPPLSIIVSCRKTGPFLSFPPLETKKPLTAEQTFQHCTSKPGSKIPSINSLLKSINLLGPVPAHLIPSARYVTYSAVFRSLPAPTPHSGIPVRDTLQFKARVPSKLTSRVKGFAKANRESSQKADISSIKSSHSCKSGLCNTKNY